MAVLSLAGRVFALCEMHLAESFELPLPLAPQAKLQVDVALPCALRVAGVAFEVNDVAVVVVLQHLREVTFSPTYVHEGVHAAHDSRHDARELLNLTWASAKAKTKTIFTSWTFFSFIPVSKTVLRCGVSKRANRGVHTSRCSESSLHARKNALRDAGHDS